MFALGSLLRTCNHNYFKWQSSGLPAKMATGNIITASERLTAVAVTQK